LVCDREPSYAAIVDTVLDCQQLRINDSSASSLVAQPTKRRCAFMQVRRHVPALLTLQGFAKLHFS
jgi:hypothetical protein